MPYMVKQFKEVTGQDLQGLSDFTRWIGQGGYYHWRVVQQGLIHLVPHLQRQPMPRMPDSCPCGKPLPWKPARSETQAMGAFGKQLDWTQPASSGSEQGSTMSQGGQSSTSSQGGMTTAPRQSGQPSTSGQSGMTTAPKQSGKSSTPHQGGGPASSSGSGTPAASGILSTFPKGGEEQVTGTRCTCMRCRAESPNPQGLHTQSG